MTESTRLSLRTTSADATFEIGHRLGELLAARVTEPGDDSSRVGATIALVGDLGTGKTIFTKGFACGAGCADHRLVSSPTYVLEQIYDGVRPIHHYDAYRLAGEEELEALGFAERLRAGVLIVIEWADRVASMLPSDHLSIELAHAGDEERSLLFTGSASVWADVFERLRE